MTGTELSPVTTSGTDSVSRVGGGDGDCLGGVATFLSGEGGPEVDSVKGRVIEECVRLTEMAALHKRRSKVLFG